MERKQSHQERFLFQHAWWEKPQWWVRSGVRCFAGWSSKQVHLGFLPSLHSLLRVYSTHCACWEERGSAISSLRWLDQGGHLIWEGPTQVANDITLEWLGSKRWPGTITFLLIRPPSQGHSRLTDSSPDVSFAGLRAHVPLRPRFRRIWVFHHFKLFARVQGTLKPDISESVPLTNISESQREKSQPWSFTEKTLIEDPPTQNAKRPHYKLTLSYFSKLDTRQKSVLS